MPPLKRLAAVWTGFLLFALFFTFVSDTLAITPPSLPGSHKGVVRRYYIAAEEVVWDFAPSGQDLLHGGPVPDPYGQNTKWDKVRFIEYTDASFTVRKPQPAWLGILGPIIRAEVGDTVEVHFFNRSHGTYNMHPHGLRYTKDNEGSNYFPTGKGSGVSPGGSFTYTWEADEDSGPGPSEPSSRVWWYHSHYDEAGDPYTGLLGPIIVTAKGKAKADGSPKDVSKEFVAAFFIFNEADDEERGLMHSINGYIFGNLPGLVMKQGEKVRWHLLGMGNEVDLHTPHWHGKTVHYLGRNTDVIELLPASMASADMNADNPGTWMFHCHVSDHMMAGMMANYTILPK